MNRNTEETRPINDIYPYVYDPEIMERRSPLARFQNEMEYYKRRLKRSNNRNVVVEKEYENENTDPLKFEKRISVTSRSKNGVLHVPGKKFASNLKKKCVEEDELHQTITATNTTATQKLLNVSQGGGNSEYFFTSSHDILGLDEDVAGENQDQNETCISNDVHKVHVRSQNAAGNVNMKQLGKSSNGSRLKPREFYNKTYTNVVNNQIRDMQMLYAFTNDSGRDKKVLTREELLRKNDDDILQNIDRILRYDRYALNSVHAFNKDYSIMHNDDQGAFSESLNESVKLKTRDDKENGDLEKKLSTETYQNSHSQLGFSKPIQFTSSKPLRHKLSRDIKESQIKYIVDERNQQFRPRLRHHRYNLRNLKRMGERTPKKKHIAMDLNRLRFEIESNPANYFKKSRNMLQNNNSKEKLTVDQFPLRVRDGMMNNDYDDSQQQEGVLPKYEDQQNYKIGSKANTFDDEQKKKIVQKLREDLLNKHDDKPHRSNANQSAFKSTDDAVEELEEVGKNVDDFTENVNSKQTLSKPLQLDQSPELQRTLNEYKSRQNEYDLKKTSDDEDGDVSPDYALIQDKKNLLEDQTEPTSAAEQKELGKNNRTHVTAIDITEIEFPAVLQVRKSSFRNVANKEIDASGFKVKESKDVIHMNNPKKIQEIASYWKQRVDGDDDDEDEDEDEMKVRERQDVTGPNEKDNVKLPPKSVLYRTRKLNSFDYETSNEEDDNSDSKNSWEREYYDENAPFKGTVRVDQRSEDDESDEDTGNDLKVPKDIEKQASKINDTEGTNKEDFESTLHFHTGSDISNDIARDREDNCDNTQGDGGIISTTINYCNSNVTMIVSYKNSSRIAPDVAGKGLKKKGKLHTHVQTNGGEITEADASTDSSMEKELDADEEIEKNDEFHDRTSTTVATGKSMLEDIKLIFGKHSKANEKNGTRKLQCNSLTKEAIRHYNDESNTRGVHHHKEKKKKTPPNVPRDDCCSGYSRKCNEKYVVGRDMPESINNPVREDYYEEESVAEPLRERLLLEKIYNSVIKTHGRIDKKHIEDYVNDVDIDNYNLNDEHLDVSPVQFDNFHENSISRVAKKHINVRERENKKPTEQTWRLTRNNKNVSRKVMQNERNHKTRTPKSNKADMLNKVEHFNDIVENNVKVQKRNLQNNRGGSLEDVPDFYLSPMLEESGDEKHREKRRLKYLTRHKKENADGVQEKPRTQHEFMLSNRVNRRRRIHETVSSTTHSVTATTNEKLVTSSLKFTSNKHKDHGAESNQNMVRFVFI